MKICEVILEIKGREIPTIREEALIEDVMETMHRYPHSRLVYVINESNELTGTISLGMLLRHVVPHKFEPAIHPRNILGLVTHETARDIMNKKPVTAKEEDVVDTVIKRMIDANVKEIGIIDLEGKLIADVTMLDLLKSLAKAEED